MTASQLSPFLPSGDQLRKGNYPAVVQDQVSQLALRILRKLLGPVVLRWRAARLRAALQQHALASYGPHAIHEAADMAMRLTSAVSLVMPELAGEDGSASQPAASVPSPSSTPPVLLQIDASGDADDVTLDGGGDDREPEESADAAAPLVGADGSHSSSSSSSAGAAGGELGEKRSDAEAGAVPISPHPPRQPRQSDSPTFPPQPLTPSQRQRAGSTAAAIAHALAGHMTLRVHLHQEQLQWAHEPSHEVLLLLAGTVQRRVAVADDGDAAGRSSTGGVTPTSVTRGSFTRYGSRRTSRLGSASSAQPSRRVSAAASSGGGVRAAGEACTGQDDADALLGTGTMQTLRALGTPASPTGRPRAATLSSLASTTVLNGTLGGGTWRGATAGESNAAPAAETLAAPVVLGELAVLGGFPYCEDVVVASDTALVASVAKEHYCALVATLPPPVQKSLMLAALQQRERMMRVFAPITHGRLRLCPLLSRLGRAELDHVQDHLIPQVYAAGMRCSESAEPQHIFFIRRGLVRMEREGFANLERGAASSPKNRVLLVEGQTFGETPCIFRESLGDVFFALSHVDAYLLPFRVLIQLMKQQPEVQAAVYKSAKSISFLREKDFEGVLTFSPAAGTVPQLQGVAPRRSSVFGRGAERRSITSRTNSVLGANAAAALSAVVSRANSTILLPSGGGPYSPTAQRLPLARGGAGTAPSRRVTIYEEETQAGGGEPGALTGGRVSLGLLAAIQQVPLLSLVASEDALKDLGKAFRCVRYERGDVIVRRGEECNRVLCFYEGRAAIVLDENQLRQKRELGVFDSGDYAAFLPVPETGDRDESGQPAALQVVPAGHMVGYTCVRRHRWRRSIVAVDDGVEVWELSRSVLAAVLRRHSLERIARVAALQVLQPLAPQLDRLYALDYQPLVHPMPSSLWAEQPVVNVHPVSLCESVLYPAWQEGDFPLDRFASDATAPSAKP